MDELIAVNAVVEISTVNFEGYFRIIANDPEFQQVIFTEVYANKCRPQDIGRRLRGVLPPGITQRTARIFDIDRDLIESWSKLEEISAVIVKSEYKLLSSAKLSPSERKIYIERERAMAPFLDPVFLSAMLYQQNGLGRLIATAEKSGACSRPTIYRLWDLLCQFGLASASLNPRFDLSGARGQKRFTKPGGKKVGRKPLETKLYGEKDSQPGMSADWYATVLRVDSKIPRPKPKFSERCDKILLGFSTSLVHSSEGVIKEAPAIWTHPTARQIRHALDDYSRLKKLLDGTTTNHYVKNLRGYHGKSWEGVAGPGHTYAMDSTIGDIYLRSQLNRAWIIGRPVVYIVVDVWSTVVVGFYVCLTGPAWRTAAVGLFCTFAEPTLVEPLRGLRGDTNALHPRPGLPYRVLVDRGEYLSIGARKTGLDLGINFAIAPPRRPDMKGIVEVLNRIAKDDQYSFAPGAFDARRPELELKADPSKSAFTLPEYTQHLAWLFTMYNLRLTRRHRMDATMVAAGISPSPAGLWKFGHDVGIGYRKTQPEDLLITALLPQTKGHVSREGIFRGKLQYRNDVLEQQQWSTIAKNFGAIETQVHHFPGSVGKAWMPLRDSPGLLELTLSDQAVVPASFTEDDYLEMIVREQLNKTGRVHDDMVKRLETMQKSEIHSERAVKLTKQAELANRGATPTTSEARAIETSELRHGQLPSEPDSSPSERNEAADEVLAKHQQRYQGLMDQIITDYR